MQLNAHMKSLIPDLASPRFETFAHVCKMLDAKKQATAMAERDLKKAEREHIELVKRSALDPSVSSADVRGAAQSVRNLQTEIADSKIALGVLETEKQRTHDLHAAAHGEAHQPLLEYSAKLRIEAAEERDRVLAELAVAEEAYRAAIEVTRYAISNSARLPYMVQPGRDFVSAAREREIWQRMFDEMARRNTVIEA